MSYYEPKDVTAPRASVSNLRPILDTGEWGYSLALLNWEGEPALGIRWNGGTETIQSTLNKPAVLKKHPGNPQSRGLSTWFVLPSDFIETLLKTALEKGLLGGGSISNNKYVETEVRKELERIED